RTLVPRAGRRRDGVGPGGTAHRRPSVARPAQASPLCGGAAAASACTSRTSRGVPGMRSAPVLFGSLLLCTLAAPALADVKGAFVVRLGQDTIGVESYTSTKDRIEVFQVGRAPRVLRRHYVYDLKDGAMTHVSLVVTPPGSSTPTQTIDAKLDGDSLRSEVKAGTNPPTHSAVGLPAGTLILSGASPWSLYESQMPRLQKSKADTVGGTMYLLGAGNTDRYLLEKVGKDSVRISNTHLDVYVAKVDK